MDAANRKTADQLRSISLRELLLWHGFEIKQEGISFRVRTDHHNIVVTDNLWFDNRTDIGGAGAIDLQMHLSGEDFASACVTLTDQLRPGIVAPGVIVFPPLENTGSLRLPFSELMAKYAVRDDQNWPISRAYLVEVRHINPSTLDELHSVGSVYANDHRPNPGLVFLHRANCGEILGASLRDTRHESPFRPTFGNKLTAWFAVGSFREARSIVAVESPIDALSYHTLFSGSRDQFVVASCSGSTVPHALLAQAYERNQSFVVALDNDAAGERGRRKAWDAAAEWAGFKISTEVPKLKDWNSDLAALAETVRVSNASRQSALHP